MSDERLQPGITEDGQTIHIPVVSEVTSRPLVTERLPNGIAAIHNSAVFLRVFVPAGLTDQDIDRFLRRVEHLGFQVITPLCDVGDGQRSARYRWPIVGMAIPQKIWPESTLIAGEISASA